MYENNEEFKNWALKLIDIHKKSTNVTVCEPSTKTKYSGVLSINSEEKEIQHRIASLKETIDVEHVELKMSRSTAEWCPNLNLVKIVKQTGTKIQSMGFQNKNGKFLTPFEALFLIETNRLEIADDEIPWTISKAYQTFLVNNDDVVKYKGYRNIALERNVKSTLGNKEMEEIKHQNKKFKKHHHKVGIEVESEQKVLRFEDIFEELQSNGPKAKVCSIAKPTEKYTNVVVDEITSNLFDSNSNIQCFTKHESSIIQITQIEIPHLHQGK